MQTGVTVTEIFLRIYGLYFLAAGVGVVWDRHLYATVVTEFRESATLTFFAGIIAFLVGAVTVTFHSDWSNWAAAIVTLIGWVALIEGVLYIGARRVMTGLIGRITLGPSAMMAIGVVVAVVGAALLWAGFSGAAA